MPRGTTQKLDENETIEFTGFVDALTMVEQTHNFIVIDTAGIDTHLTRLAHSMANTLITPLNDSFVDFSVLGTVDPETYSVTGESHYAQHGARGPPAAAAGRRRAAGLGGGAQPGVVARFAQQAAHRARAWRTGGCGSASAWPIRSATA